MVENLQGPNQHVDRSVLNLKTKTVFANTGTSLRPGLWSYPAMPAHQAAPALCWPPVSHPG